MNGCWRKGSDGIDLYSPVTGAFFQFKSDYDLSFLSHGFVGVRIMIVVKDSGGIFEKLLLVTSKTQMIVAARVNNAFNQNNALNRHTALILAMSADENPAININLFPKNKPARQYVIRYEKRTKMFQIPDGLATQAMGSTSSDIFGDKTTGPIHAELGSQSEIGAQSLQLMEINAKNRNRLSNDPLNRPSNRNDANCMVCFGAHHSLECQEGKLENCFECHVPIANINDHASMCAVKQWFLSKKSDKLVKIPIVRWVIEFQSPISAFIDGKFQEAKPQLKLFSGMSDSYFVFESDKKLIVMTTGW